MLYIFSFSFFFLFFEHILIKLINKNLKVGGLDFLELLDNTGLHLLPLSLPRTVHDAGQEPVN